MSPADELRKAVEILRCDHRHPMQPPHGLDRLGACVHCGAPWRYGPLVADELAEPLADFLDETANVMDWLGPPRATAAGLSDGMGVPRSEWDRALTLARAIRGGDAP